MASKLPAHSWTENSTFIFAENHPEDPSLGHKSQGIWLRSTIENDIGEARCDLWSEQKTEMEFYFETAMTCWRNVKWEGQRLPFMRPSVSLIVMSISKRYLGNSQLWWNISEMVIGCQVGGNGCEYVAAQYMKLFHPHSSHSQNRIFQKWRIMVGL